MCFRICETFPVITGELVVPGSFLKRSYERNRANIDTQVELRNQTLCIFKVGIGICLGLGLLYVALAVGGKFKKVSTRIVVSISAIAFLAAFIAIYRKYNTYKTEYGRLYRKELESYMDPPNTYKQNIQEHA